MTENPGKDSKIFCAPLSESFSKTNSPSFSFFVTGGAHGQQVKICRKMFIGLFSFSENKLMAITQRMTNLSSHDQVIPEVGTDGRGRSRTNVYRRVPEDILESIDETIIKIIKKEGEPSHWNRDRDNSIYLPCSRSVKKLWRDVHLKEHDPQYFDQLQQARLYGTPILGQPLVSKRRFHDRFCEKFGYVKFYKPKTDECKSCLTFKSNLSALSDSFAKQKNVTGFHGSSTSSSARLHDN